MEAISYVNIFETKGIEYLLVVTFLICIVLFAKSMKSPSQRSLAHEPRNHPEYVEDHFICDLNPAECSLCPMRRSFQQSGTGELESGNS